MFFKNEPVVTRIEIIKKSIENEQGRTLVQINIQYPVITGREKDPYKKAAEPFYRRLHENFLSFAETQLAEKAKRLIETKEDFLPLGAVMKHNITLDGEKFISMYADISVFDGENPAQSVRSAQVWGKNDGYIYSFGDIFFPEAKKTLTEQFAGQGTPENKSAEEYIKLLRRYFSENSFYITDSGVFFFYQAELLGFRPGIRTFYVGYAEADEKKLLKLKELV